MRTVDVKHLSAKGAKKSNIVKAKKKKNTHTHTHRHTTQHTHHAKESHLKMFRHT